MKITFNQAPTNAPRTLLMCALLAVSMNAGAATPTPSTRVQLQQMVEQLQKAPIDNALREKIIKLAQELTPAPALPAEAERRMVRGSAAFKGAVSVADYQDAAKEFEQATLAAPWYGDAYFNLGVAQDKAGNYEAALRSLKLAQLASPDGKEIQSLTYEVEYRQEKANSPAARAAKEKEAEEQFLAALEGAHYVCPDFRSDDFGRRIELDVKNGKVSGVNIITWINPRLKPGENYSRNVFVGSKHHTWWEGGDIVLSGRVTTQSASTGERMRVEIDSDRLVYSHQIPPYAQNSPQTCVRAR